MIVDSSALIAILFDEPRAEELVDRLASANPIGIGAPTLVETTLVASSRLRRDARGTVARLLQEFEIEVIPFTSSHFGVAVDAWHRFGRGRHAANLNFGDCLSYAVARVAARPLLCIGNDFPRTDLALA
jgi:ribonuclease VapC